ncbi:MAG TPA: bifunctional proline dehydrogenase/L-glutamate gamma-semialdehyde dehydrogenase PutA [Alphaproteobacteria bacterium]|nr:bifunctional proline dehydrogenase/L-glutamate gamma-semialdehyde dehydrogenase PutA [Alphaproteobacteria bacterium]
MPNDLSTPALVFAQPPAKPSPAWAAIGGLYRADETQVVERLLAELALPADQLDRIAERARGLVAEVRRQRVGKGGLDAFLHEYALSSQEGVVLMCLAEALLRIPDAETADLLIRDKLRLADWEKHLGKSDSLFVNASTWALMLTGRVVKLGEFKEKDLSSLLGRLVARSGEPVIRQAMMQAMRIMGRQFVMGRTIEEALERARAEEPLGYRHSYDMLGEAARTAKDAERYLEAYDKAISALGKAAAGRGPIAAPGISIKLSALHPRYEFAQRARVLKELTPRLAALARHAKEVNIGVTVDAEEADRLELSLEVFAEISRDPSLAGWDGLGLAVQAYQKRATAVIDWLAELARRDKRRLMVRLVKGAYWDSEIKRAQERGLDGYPVFTRKAATDISYLACARRLLHGRDAFYPQFATHNAHTLSAILEFAGNNREFEFQRLHGMGEALYEQVVGKDRLNIPCRIYAPVGSHEDLLPYLVRRLLENGANTSFVNRIVDERAPIADIIADPIARMRKLPRKPHPRIALPRDIYLPERLNAKGIDLSDVTALEPLAREMERAANRGWRSGPIIGGVERAASAKPAYDPTDRRRRIGEVSDAGEADLGDALERAHSTFPLWDETPAAERAKRLERMADLLERDMAPLMALCTREGGKTLADGIAEVREAADFCRYYAHRARLDFGAALHLPGPTGERNELSLHGRGVVVCISPWNFPLAIFTGQIAAALAAGNAAIAKPAEQTPLIAAHAVRLFHEAGIPADALQLLPGPGETIGAKLVADPRVAGVVFTGSTETARAIGRALAARPGPIIPLIAETGGQNAMIVDSSALPEQVVQDVLASSFQSAGQRCSALRVLFVQEEIADKLLDMLAGAMAELRIGDPGLLTTDVGPVIDQDAKAMLEAHAERMTREGRLIYRTSLGADCAHGTFVAPAAFEIDRIARLEREVFGPILHVVRYRGDRLDAVIDAVNGTGYGLTLGVHSRVDSTIAHIARRARVGNAYVNRNMIGAVVGVQPFGGEGLSGTGPKAGGPHYLHRFAVERTLSVNTTAQGGNTALMSLQEED